MWPFRKNIFSSICNDTNIFKRAAHSEIFMFDSLRDALDRNNRPDIDDRSDAAGRCRRFLPGRPHSVFHASLADQKCSRLCIPAYRGALQCCLADSSQGSNRGCESLIRLYNNNHLQITKTVNKTPLLLAHGSQSQLFEKGYLTIILYICERSCLVWPLN